MKKKSKKDLLEKNIVDKLKNEREGISKTVSAGVEYANLVVAIRKDFIYSKYKSKIDLLNTILDIIKILLTISASLLIAILGLANSPLPSFFIIFLVLVVSLVIIFLLRSKVYNEYIKEYEKLIMPLIEQHTQALNLINLFLNIHKDEIEFLTKELKNKNK